MSRSDLVHGSTNPFPTPRPVIYLVGDSLTQRGTDPDNSGWVSLMQHRYNRSADIITRGLSGYTTKWIIESAIPVMERELSGALRSPSLITIWLGANDAALPDGHAAGQHVPLATYKENLVKIIQFFQTRAPKACILLITPPHVDDAVRMARSPSGCAERTNAVTGLYAQACVDVARELNVHVLDMYTFFHTMPDRDRAQCLDDGLHFTAEGNRLVEQQLQAKIVHAFPSLVKQLEAWQLPDFRILMEIPKQVSSDLEVIESCKQKLGRVSRPVHDLSNM